MPILYKHESQWLANVRWGSVSSLVFEPLKCLNLTHFLEKIVQLFRKYGARRSIKSSHERDPCHTKWNAYDGWSNRSYRLQIVSNVRTMNTTYLHIDMILSTLSLSPHGFALGLYPKDLIPIEIFVYPYIPMILPTSSQCGTLVVYPTILPSNKGPPSLPSNRSFIRPLSTSQDSSFSTSPCWGQDTSMKHPKSTTWLGEFLLFLGQPSSPCWDQDTFMKHLEHTTYPIELIHGLHRDWEPTTFCSAFRGFIHHG